MTYDRGHPPTPGYGTLLYWNHPLQYLSIFQFLYCDLFAKCRDKVFAERPPSWGASCRVIHSNKIVMELLQ